MKKQIKVLLLAEFLIAIGLGMLGPFYAIYIENLTKDSNLIGYSYAAFWFTVGIFSPVIGKLADRKDKRVFLLIGGFLAFFVSILYGLINNLYQLIFVEVINGVATACFNPAYRALTADITTKNKRGFEYGLLDSVSYMTYGLAAILATVIFNLFGFVFLFVSSGLFQLASSIVISRKIKFR
ncbi:MAG: MFS transporter [Candidatus Aenigmarchaeota archaeon]|nr:MFS transporter [Candidatus Aenigmarchaeota archaeon]